MRFRAVLTGVELERRQQAFFNTRPCAEDWATKLIERLTEDQKPNAIVEIYTLWEAIHERVTVKGIERKRSTGGEPPDVNKTT